MDNEIRKTGATPFLQWILNIIWRLQFKKVKIDIKFHPGRCIDCAGWQGKIDCYERYCPCKINEQLKKIF